MADLAIAVLLMVLIVVPMIGWVVRKDRRRQLEAGGPSGAGKEEVA
jgi:hypothetical protein